MVQTKKNAVHQTIKAALLALKCNLEPVRLNSKMIINLNKVSGE